jgi:hypothetical protein
MMVRLNMIEEEFRTRRIEEREHTAYFVMRHERDCEQDKKKREEERARKTEKARHVKEAFAQGGEQVLIKGKLPRLTQDS